ncbi:methyltransferase [Candidatus Woesearchaeota archaeon]|nr:methyltransferase [Candidatus Woesearchaeota archaeon]
MDIYEPAEDSYLLQKAVRDYATGRVLDLGTGSGIQAFTAIRIPEVKEVVALDINPDAIKALQQKITHEKLRKLKVLQSDLFEQAYGKFNTIIFNPPYLPQDKGIDDNSIYGGRKGWEISERFFQEASHFLFPDGIILFLFSTHTNKKKIEEILAHHLLEFEEVGREKVAFETLYVYRITKSVVLRELEKKGIGQIHYLAQGKRGLVFQGSFDRSTPIKTHFPSRKETLLVAIKIPQEGSKAVDAIRQEAVWLALVNQQGIGPRLLFTGDNFMVSEFIEGEFFVEWLEHHSPAEVRKAVVAILRQCHRLDQLHITKEEMHHPLKHIIMTQHNQPVLIDFERCRTTEKPQNVTQFVEFLCRLQDALQKRGLSLSVSEIRSMAKEYKQKYNQEIIEIIIKSLSSG